MSGGTLMVWLLVCKASIGVPAAIAAITGTATGTFAVLGAAAAAAHLAGLPSMTDGVKPRRPPPPPLAEISGSLITRSRGRDWAGGG